MNDWDPAIYRWQNEDDRRAFMQLMQSRPHIKKFDTYILQVRDLIRSRVPGRRLAPEELESLVNECFSQSSPGESGTWVYYPWSERLVHVLARAEFIELRTNRNHYKITPDEQKQLQTKRVGVVGLSVGQSVAMTLALERSFGEIRLADFDTVDLSNLNRIRTGVHNLSLPKVIVTAREIMEIDPYLSITIFEQGVTPDNLERFLNEGGPLDLIIEECDSLDVKCLIREGARRRGIPVVMETSDRGMLDIERFDVEPERPIFHGLIGDLDPASVRGLTTEQKIPVVLRIIGEENLSTRLRASLV